MNPVLAGAVIVGVIAVPASSVTAGSIHTPMQGSFGDPFSTSGIHGIGWNAAAGAGDAGPLIGNLYDNILTINGGAATAGYCGPFQTCSNMQAFVDWVNTAAQWGDDLHGISAGGVGPAVVTKIRYGYSNALATTTHVIKIYDMVPPSVVPSVTALISKGALVASVVVVGNPTGANIVTVTGLNIQLPGSAVWIKFEEQGLGIPGTFWLTGGNGYSGIGTSHPGVTYTLKNYYPDGTNYNLWIPLPYFYISVTGYVASNIQVALSGFHIPAPAVIILLGLGGLVTLRRRRDTRSGPCRSRARRSR